MAAALDLSIAPHDLRLLGSSKNAEVFRHFVRVERVLAQLLNESLQRDEAMLSSTPRPQS